MKKILTLICLLALSTGLANAHPIMPQHSHYKQSVPMQKVLPPPPKPIPVVYQQAQFPAGYNYGYSNPSVTFSLGNVDVTVGL